MPNSRTGWHVLLSGFLPVDLANTWISEVEEEEAETKAPVDPATEAMTGDTVPVEGLVAASLLSKVLLVSIVLGLLFFIIRRRRRSNMVVNEKSLA